MRRFILAVAIIALPGVAWGQSNLDYNAAINSAPSTAGIIAKCAPDGDSDSVIDMERISAVKTWGSPLLRKAGLFDKSWVGLNENDPGAVKEMLLRLTNYAPSWADEVDKNSPEGKLREALSWAASLEFEIFLMSHPDGKDHRFFANLVAQKALACIRDARSATEVPFGALFDKYYELLKPQSDDLFENTLIYYSVLRNRFGPQIYFTPTNIIAREAVTDNNVNLSHVRLMLMCHRSKDDADGCERYNAAVILAGVREAKKRFGAPPFQASP